MTVAKMTSKGQITVPKAVRERLGLVPGDELEFVDEGEQLVIRRHDEDSRFARYRGFLKHLQGQDPDEMLSDMRGEP
jgi:AbrB family looped-hinge helix DNA binding protein